MQGSHLRVVSGGAKLLTNGTTSLEAEARALHLSLEYFRRIVYPREALLEVEEVEPIILFTDLCRDILARSLNWESDKPTRETVFQHAFSPVCHGTFTVATRHRNTASWHLMQGPADIDILYCLQVQTCLWF